MLKSKKSNLKLALSVATAITLGAGASAYAATNLIKGVEDGTFVSVTGTVGKVIDSDEFMLNTSMGQVKVDTNDRWPNLFMAADDSEPQMIITTGDKVTVKGFVDENYFTKKEIDATDLAFAGTGYTTVYYYKTDEADTNYSYWYNNENYGENMVSLSGSVAKIMGEDEFLLNYTGGGTIRVETDDIDIAEDNKLRVGEAVTVYGEIEDGWFEKKELEASTLYRGSTYR